MSFFFSSTPQFKQVEAATSEMLIGPDWAANMEIWDAVSRSMDGGREYLKAIEKRMGHKNAHVVNLALELLGSCVKNCGGRFHQQVHSQSFLNSLVRVSKRTGSGGNEQAVREKALTLIMAWAEAFERVRGMPNFAGTYDKLRQSGVQFPARDMNEMAPVFTPARSVEEQQAASASAAAPAAGGAAAGGAQQQQQAPASAASYHPFSSVTPAYVDKVKAELRQVMGYVAIVRDMLLAAESPERVQREDSLTQLVQVLREVQSRLIRILVEVNDERLVDVIVQVNEHVGVALQWHRAAGAGHEFTVPELPPPTGLEDAAVVAAASPEPVPAAARNANDDDDEEEEDAAAPADEFQNMALERSEDAAADKGFDDLAAGPGASSPKHRKTPSQELEELLGLTGGAGGDESANVDVSAQEFEDLLGLTEPQEPGAAKKDPAILDDL